MVDDEDEVQQWEVHISTHEVVKVWAKDAVEARLIVEDKGREFDPIQTDIVVTDVVSRRCPACRTQVDEDGYCIDPGCSNCGKAVLAEVEDPIAEARDLLIANTDVDTWDEVGPKFTCREADAIAGVFEAVGAVEVAERFLAGHARGDYEEDAHWTGTDPEEER